MALLALAFPAGPCSLIHVCCSSCAVHLVLRQRLALCPIFWQREHLSGRFLSGCSSHLHSSSVWLHSLQNEQNLLAGDSGTSTAGATP